jgi:hypothetical protein
MSDSKKQNLSFLFKGFVVVIGLFSASPGIADFIDKVPPWLKGWSSLISVFLFAIYLLTYALAYPKTKRRRNILLICAIGLLGGAIILAIIYSIMLGATTVIPTSEDVKIPEQRIRRQIGFDMCKWSLTDKAIKTIEKMANTEENSRIQVDTPRQLMRASGVWSEPPTRISEIWTSESICLAASFLTILFFVPSIMLSIGLGIVMRILFKKSFL